MKKLAKNNKGFSLVELIVVIAIMAVLVGVLAPQLIKYVEKSREATDIQNCDSIATSLKSYYSDKEGKTGSMTVTLKTTGLDENSKKDPAIKDAGLENTKLKGTGWGKDGIIITYNFESGKITYTANSDHYNATNSDEIRPGKAPASGDGGNGGNGGNGGDGGNDAAEGN